MQTSIEHIEPIVKEVARDLGLRRVILFGSLARGTQTERSDIDLIVVRETNERFVERPTEILMLLYGKLRGWAIDVLVYTPEEYERMLAHGNFFLTRAVREGRIVYES